MRIVYCIDENYKEYAIASIKSVKKHNPTAEFTIVSCSPVDVLGIENFVINLDGEYRFKTGTDRISKSAYLKLYLTQLPYDKIIYIDADVKCQHPMDDLWNMPCDYICLTESHNYGKMQAKAIGVDRYALTGMMVMNLKALRDIDFTNRCLFFQSAEIDTKFWQHDETCINLGMKGMLSFIDKKFNYCHNRKYKDKIPERDAVLLHYVGREKIDMLSEIELENRVKYEKLPKKDIKGKRVAIVGNAKSIFGKKNGLEIDRHDVIIRFNRGLIIAPESQGQMTDFLFLGTNMSYDEIQSYRATYVINRSANYLNPANYTISNFDRQSLRDKIGRQPSTGFMAIDFCIESGANHIDLYGFDFGLTKTFYNPDGYETQHDYNKEQELVAEYVKSGLLTIK